MKLRMIVHVSLLLIVTTTNIYAIIQTPGAENAALRYWMAFAQMQDPPGDRSTSDLLESVASGRAPWNEVQLGPILDQNRMALEAFQRATRITDCDWGLEYQLGPEAPVAHLPRARVLARLNTLAGMRLMARGQIPQAVDTWLAGVRFSRHLAEGSSLVSLLTARVALTSNLQALNQATRSVSLTAADRRKVQSALNALPETVFDWSAAIRHEQSGIEIFVQQLSRAADPRGYYERLVGPAPRNFSVPAASDVNAFRAFMARAAAALRLSPDTARVVVVELEKQKENLHPLFRQMIPSLERVNDVRVELVRERQNLLDTRG